MLNRWLKVLFVVAAGTLLLAGCSSEKKASKENFKKAIAAYLQDNGGYLVGTSKLPAAIPANALPKIEKTNFALLSAAGMVNVTLGTGKDGKPEYKYALADQGKKYFVKGKGFKTSDQEVTSVEGFTGPTTDPTGTQSVVVNYKYQDVPNQLGKIINKDAKTETLDGSNKLVLSDKGWKVVNLMR